MIPAVRAVRAVYDWLPQGAGRSRRAFVGFELELAPAGLLLVKAPSWATYRVTQVALRATPTQ